MKSWYKLRYFLSCGSHQINSVHIDTESLGDNLEDAIKLGRPAVEKLLKLDENSPYLTLVSVGTR